MKEMKSVAFFDSKLQTKSFVETCNIVKIGDVEISVGIIKEENTVFEEIKSNKNGVLVRKKAFSCNFRDKPLINYVHNKIKEGESNGELFISHFGSEFVGEVVDVGKNVKGFKLGDRVIPNISYPSYSKDYTPGLPTNGASKRYELFEENKLLKVPNKIPCEVLAAFPIAAFTAYSMVRKVVKKQDKILVTAGSSNTSLAVLSALRNYSVDVFVMTTNKYNSSRFKQLGVKDVILINRDGSVTDQWSLEIIKKAGKFNVVIDPFFDFYLPKILDLLDMEARYITCGLLNQNHHSHQEIEGSSLRNIFINLMINNVTVFGNCIGKYEDGKKALDDYQKGSFEVTVDSVFTKGQEGQFLQRTYNSKERFGKVVYVYD